MAVAAALIALVGCAAARAAAFPVDIHDDHGHQVTLRRAPARIVTLLPSLTEAVCELGACGRLVGTDRYSNWPAMVLALPKLGGLDDAELEATVALHPDLVIASGSSRIAERLAELGIPVVAFEANTLADERRVLSTIATLLGEPAAADALWRDIMERIASAAAMVPNATRGARVYVEVGDAPYAAGAGSFIGELLARLGLGNIAGRELGAFPKLNPEFVVRAQPDLIIAPASELTEMRRRPGWERLRALRDGRVCRFAAAQFDVIVRPGPRLGEAAKWIAECVAHLPPRGAP